MDGKIVHIPDANLEEDVCSGIEDLIEESSDFDSVLSAYKSKTTDCIRYSIMFDATSSMSPVWTVAKKAVTEAVNRIRSYKVSKPVEINIIAYRDIIDDYDVLSQSGFTSDLDRLTDFISKTTCFGGGDFPENPELGFEQVIDSESNMIIWIGDAPPHGFPFDNNYKIIHDTWEGKEEALALGQQNCPIYGMYLYNGAKTRIAFKTICELSGGKAYYMENVSTFTDTLITLLNHDKDLIKYSMAYIPYIPQTDLGKTIDKDLS